VLRLCAALAIVNLALIGLGLAVKHEPPQHGDVKIGLVFDVGGRGDKSFNDAAWKGLTRARDELGVSIEAIEPGDGSDREGALRQLASEGCQLVIGVGFIFSRDLDALAAQYPNTAFAGIDYAPDDAHPIGPNLRALKFREEQGSFLVGAIAAMTTRTKIVGFVGGMQIPLIRKFEAGYIAGVHHECPDCQVLSVYAGTEPSAFADPTLGGELAEAQLGRGADVIFHAAGKTGIGVIDAVAEHRAWVIGVDADQFAEAPCCVLTSMTKEVDVAVVDAVRAVLEHRFTGGIQQLGLAEGGVDFVADDDNRDRLPPEVVGRARELAAEIVAGKIQVPSE
jgi:basic membrane protein A